jgi:3',5'-cyclic AMP phosphodiesterase CpdA
VARAAWLARRLEEAGDRPVFLFMHHPPFDIGIPALDAIRLRDTTGFEAAIAGRDNIRHIFFGHVHRPVSGAWRGIPYSACLGLAHQVALDFETVGRVPYSDHPPCYAVILLEEAQTTVHLHAYLDDRPLAV